MAELKLQQSRLDGRYDVVECLGRGSYAEIYVAKDNAAPEGAPTPVVIKALNIYLQGTPDAELERTLVANFQNEAVAIDRVRHPHIINRLGHGTAIDLAGTTFHYIVLEYLPGGDMMALSRHHPLSIEKTLFFLEQVCSGLAHAHQCGVIHRDIKPQNLLLTADRKIIKIADFGVARFEATEGAITRVGTNIYSAPEHNPLVQTSQLDTGSLVTTPVNLTPAADIYSLAKTTYSLLAGEAPRRFAHHSIGELPPTISNEYWSAPVLRVLEKATQRRPENRYQTVQEFWDELAEAALPPTRPLNAANLKQGCKPSSGLSVEPEDINQAPPRARFELARAPELARASLEPSKRPRIVVPVSRIQQVPERTESIAARPAAKDIVAGFPNQSRSGKPSSAQGYSRRPAPRGRPRRFLVALLLILSFSGMLLATHKYVTSQWNPLRRIAGLPEVFVVGREGVTTTDVNLRAGPGSSNQTVGLAEIGSRVKVLRENNNWYEVQVVTHGRAKNDQFSSERGWINKRFVEFD
ncbi:MAG: serine/threonine protein kinase [Acidobacteria bacterium]|nr:serine/threonine protein kinase [Acidobacteriota bacterium]